MSEVIELKPVVPEIDSEQERFEHFIDVVEEINLRALDKVLQFANTRIDFSYAASRLTFISEKIGETHNQVKSCLPGCRNY